jgi:aldehyde dehydrogenase (NAD+)
VQIGPLISARQRDRVRGHLATAQREGAHVLTGGSSDVWDDAPGFYMVPTILGGVGDDAAVAREEIFGPVLTVFVFDEIDEVIARANDTPFGLTAGVWTESLGTAQRMISALRSGTVWVNDYLPLEPALPHGGVKLSGYGREGGMEQIEEYLETKAVLVRTHA